MTRTQLFNLAIECGIKEDKQKALQLIEERLKAYFNSDEGIEYLKNAPKIEVEGNDDFPLRDVDTIVRLLLEEVAEYEFR